MAYSESNLQTVLDRLEDGYKAVVGNRRTPGSVYTTSNGASQIRVPKASNWCSVQCSCPCPVSVFRAAVALFHAVHIDLSLAQVMIVVLATNLAVTLPAAPASLGVFEFAVVSTLAFYGIDRLAAVSGAVLLHALFILPISVLGLGLFLASSIAPGPARSSRAHT